MKKSLLIIPLALSLVLAGCNEEPAATSTTEEPSTSQVTPTSTSVVPPAPSSSTSGSVTPSGVLSVTLNKESLDLDVYTKKSETLVATVEVEGGVSTATKWESSDKNVASVSNGEVHAKSKGTATIKVSSTVDPTKFATCFVTVSDSTPPAALHTAQVKFGTGSFASLEPMSDVPEGEGGQYQYKLVRDVTGGDTITFKFDGEVVKAGDGSSELEPHSNNTFGNFDDGYVVHNDAEKADIYFKVYETGYSFWISGYDSESPDPEPPAPTPIWFLKGTMNEWSLADPLSVAPSEDPNVEKQYAITKHLDVNDEFKFAGPDNLWIGYECIENKNSLLTKNETEGLSFDNIVVNAEGDYTFYLKDLVEPVDGKDYLVYVGYPEGVKYIDASYGANVNVGEAIDPSLLTVEFVDGENRTDIKGEATYKLGDEDFSFDHVFSEAGEYNIDVKYTVDEKEYTGEFTINVVVENSYGLYFSEEKIVNLTPIEEKDPEGRDQFYAQQVEFKEDEIFKLINFATGEKFVAPLDLTSFGGHYSAYLDVSDNGYRPEGDFYASVYAKFKFDDDQIYFELANAPVSVATIKVGEADAEEMEAMTPPFDDPNLTQQFEYVVDAVSGMEITFKVDGKDVPTGDNRREGNISVNNGTLTFLYDQEDCHIYLKVYASGYNFYATYDTNFYVVYEGTSWDRDPNFVMTSFPSEDYKEQYRFVWNDLAENTEFKVLTLRPAMGNNGYIGWADVTFEESGNNFEEGSSTNIKCKNTGNYEIFFKINNDDSLAIYINELPEANTLVVSYSGGDILKGGTIDASKLTVTYYDDESKPTDVKEEAKYSLNGTAIPDIETEIFDNAGTFTIDVTYNSKGASFTIKVVDEDTMSINVYVQGDDLGNKFANGGAVFYLWYWGDGIPGYLVSVNPEKLNDNEITFTISLPNTVEGCKLLRCDPNAEISEGEDYPGSGVWHETDNMEINLEYHCANGNMYVPY